MRSMWKNKSNATRDEYRVDRNADDEDGQAADAKGIGVLRVERGQIDRGHTKRFAKYKGGNQCYPEREGGRDQPTQAQVFTA